MEDQNKTQNPTKSKSGLIFLLFLLLILLGVVTWLYVNQRNTTEEIQTVLTAEKDSLQTHLEQLKAEYDELMTDNDSINNQLIQEKKKIDKLIAELKTTKATNFTKIKQLEAELGTLREVAQSYVRQIDSLNTMNQELVAENIKVKNEITVAQTTNKELEEKNKDLTGKVEYASVLRTENLQATPINKRGKENNKINKIEKIKIDFTIKENVLAKQGERDIFVRIAGPDDYILAKSEEDLFEFEGKQIVFSAKRPIDFVGKDLGVTIFWDNNGALIPGTYEVYIFGDGAQIGTTTFDIQESGWF
jgi:DNA repair exonuclease SbcCD ATPase subunit